MEYIFRLIAPVFGIFGSSFTVIGLVYTGINLKGLSGGSHEVIRGAAMTIAGLMVLAFAVIYGYSQ